jgi:hypothetical protein
MRWLGSRPGRVLEGAGSDTVTGGPPVTVCDTRPDGAAGRTMIEARIESIAERRMENLEAID